MTPRVYNATLYKLLTAALDLSSGTFRVALVTSDYSPDVDGDEFWSDADDHEASGAGYSAGGQALAGVALTRADASDRVEFTAAGASWPAVTVAFRYAVLYKDAGAAASSPLLVCYDFETEIQMAGLDLTIRWDDDGGLFIARQGG